MLATGAAQATTWLDTIPGPDDTGGMVMRMVNLDFQTQTVSIGTGMHMHMTQDDTVTMYPLAHYNVQGTYPYADSVFNPALAGEPWYDLLDPSRQHLPFSTRFGLGLGSGNADQIPLGTYVAVKAIEISDGLKIYDVGYWADVWQQDQPMLWHQVFGEGNFGGTLSPELDNVAIWGDSSSIKMWHPVVLVPSEGIYSARFEIYLADDLGQALEGWTSASLSFNWHAVAVPEPATAVLLTVAACLSVMGLRHNRRNSNRRRGKLTAG